MSVASAVARAERWVLIWLDETAQHSGKRPEHAETCRRSAHNTEMVP
jgi:hypothetical protein